MEFQSLSINNVKSIKQLAIIDPSIDYAVSRDSTSLLLVAISPDNQYLACASAGSFWCSEDDPGWTKSCLSIVDYKCNKVVCRLPYLGNKREVIPQCLAYSPDGKYLAFDDGDSLYIWDLQERDLGLVVKYQHIQVDTYSDPEFPIINFQFISVNENWYLYVANPANIQIIIIQSSDNSSAFFGYYREAIIKQDFPHENALDRRFLSPNGQFLITIPQNVERQRKRIIYLRTVPSYEIVWSHPITGCACLAKSQAICFHPSSELLAIGQQGQVSIFRIPEGELVSILRLPRDFDVESLAFSPNGELLAMGLLKASWVDGYDLEPTIARDCSIWDWEWGAPIMQLPEVREDSSFLWHRELKFSFDGSRLVVRNDEQLQIWGLDSQEQTQNQNYRLISDDSMELPDGYENWDDYWDSTPD